MCIFLIWVKREKPLLPCLPVPALFMHLTYRGLHRERCGPTGSSTGSFSTTTMVKESFTAGNKQVSPKGQAGYLMRGY